MRFSTSVFFHQTIPPRAKAVSNMASNSPRKSSRQLTFLLEFPFNIYVFYSCKYVMFTYVFVFAIVSL
jgi:hypothetical protein